MDHADRLVSMGAVAESESSASNPTRRKNFGAPGSTAWIFQCPEDSYTSWVQDIGGGRGGWCLKKYKSEVKEGDLAYIWVSGKNAGIRALTIVEESPTKPGSIYVTEGWSPGDYWVGFAPLEILDEPVWRKELKADPRLAQLTILRCAIGSTFKVRENERAVIDEYIAAVYGELTESLNPTARVTPSYDDQGAHRVNLEARGLGSVDGASEGLLLAEAVGEIVSERLRIDEPLIKPAPELADVDFPEAYLLDYPALGEADFFIRASDFQVEVGLMLDSASMGSREKRHPIDRFSEQVWAHIELVYEDEGVGELRWGFDGVPSAESGFALGSPGGLTTWYRSPGQQWVCASVGLTSGPATPEVANRTARVLIALDCLSFRDGDRLMLTPPSPRTVFVSYSHQDLDWVKRDFLPQVRTAAGPSVEFWWDAGLTANAKWTDQLERQIADCHGAILVVTMASLRPERFTWSQEVPELLRRQEDDGIPFLGVLAEEVGQEGMAQLQKAGIGLINADVGRPGEPVFPIGVHKWNTATVQALLSRNA